MTEYCYPKYKRLLKPDQFNTVFNKPLFKVHQTHLMAFVADTGQNQARLGLAITKKKIPTAVARNKIKRTIREDFRHQHPYLPAVDIVFIVKRSTKELSSKELRDEVAQILSKVRRKFKSNY